MQVDQPVARIARGRQVHLVFVDGGAAGSHLLDERQQGAAERHKIAQQLAPQQHDGRLEEGLRRHVRVSDLAVGGDDDDRQRQRVEHRVRGAVLGAGCVQGRVVHAGVLQANAS
jgi:hypothetical protein